MSSLNLVSDMYGSSSDDDEEEEEQQQEHTNEQVSSSSSHTTTNQDNISRSPQNKGTTGALSLTTTTTTCTTGRKRERDEPEEAASDKKAATAEETANVGEMTACTDTVRATGQSTMMTQEQYNMWLKTQWENYSYASSNQTQTVMTPPQQTPPAPQSMQNAQGWFSTPLPEAPGVNNGSASSSSTSTNPQAQSALPVAPDVWRHMDKVTKKQLMEAQQSGGNQGPKLVTVHQNDVQGSWDPQQFYEQQLKNQQEKQSVGGKVWNPSAGAAVRVSQPSRTQKQKHQINHLVDLWKAQENDIQHKEAKSRKTKAQTWAKYGW